MQDAERELEIWFLTGSQELYGEEVLAQVASQSQEVCETLAASVRAAPRIVWKPVLTTSDGIRRACLDATSDDAVVGIIAWMHTFSPAKAWIAGLEALGKPLLHLHTQANRSLPWAELDMDFMNLNQAAHGDREFGYVQSRLGVARKTVAGHVGDPAVAERVSDWARAAAGWQASQSLKMARFGDNMRGVAVTDGDKVGAQAQLGVSVNAYGVNDLVAVVDEVTDADVDKLVAEYEDTYRVADELRRGGERHESLRYGGRLELGHARVPRGRRLHGVHDELRGPRRAAPAPRPRRAAPDGRRLRLRRRGRLEDLGAAAHPEGHLGRPRRRHVVHGGLHVPLGTGGAEGPRCAHAGGLPDHRRGRPDHRGPPALDRRPRGPGADGLHRGARSRCRGRSRRPRRAACA